MATATLIVFAVLTRINVLRYTFGVCFAVCFLVYRIESEGKMPPKYSLMFSSFFGKIFSAERSFDSESLIFVQSHGICFIVVPGLSLMWCDVLPNCVSLQQNLFDEVPIPFYSENLQKIFRQLYSQGLRNSLGYQELTHYSCASTEKKENSIKQSIFCLFYFVLFQCIPVNAEKCLLPLCSGFTLVENQNYVVPGIEFSLP